jgi:sodium/bile acid cotransporter 7
LWFRLDGARLSPQAVWRGLANWRAQLLIVAGTFGLLPLPGLAVRVLVPTVQVSVTFTSIAGGNVAAAAACRLVQFQQIQTIARAVLAGGYA